MGKSCEALIPVHALRRSTPRLRVLLRLDMIETYINDVFIATYSPASFPTGRIGVLDPAASVAGSAAAANASIWLMTLPGSGLAYQAPALASSIYQPGGDVYSAGRATDGDPATRWSSGRECRNTNARPHARTHAQRTRIPTVSRTAAHPILNPRQCPLRTQRPGCASTSAPRSAYPR